MTTGLEIGANALNAASIFLAARNSIHTWWVGTVGCALFMALFFLSRLYADALLQVFFIATSVLGWWLWLKRGRERRALPITHAAWPRILQSILMALAAAAGYGYLLSRYTDAFAPFADSLILTLSVSAQILLMQRKYESWWFWLAVNSLSVVVFGIRGLWVTAALYAVFWVNAAFALLRWRRYLSPA
jgi:nicotinamide mononucleotide transporter